jgi:protein-L-isoaspartate(D-aspartate) O-methyltransferase
MDRQAELAIVRRAYAKQVAAAARISDARIEQAFAAVHREQFLGAGPWQMMRLPSAYVTTPDADPVLLYVDQVVGLIPERGINNGQPSLHAMLLAAVRIEEGDHVVHVGAGTGYYTAIMALLAGQSGRVTAIEYDSALAARARECLSGNPTVNVVEGDGTATSLEGADVIYVNAGVTRPADCWLDALSEGGRLLIPLTTDNNFPPLNSGVSDLQRAMNSGAYFLIRRQGAAFEARGLLPTVIVPAKGARDEASEELLSAAFAKGGWHSVTRLVRGAAAAEERCWLRGDGWCLVSD